MFEQKWICKGSITYADGLYYLFSENNGNAALAYTRLQRRQLRQMVRAELIMPHILYEAALAHAPVADEVFPNHTG